MITERQIQIVMAQTGMGYMPARRHLLQRLTLGYAMP